MGTLRRDELKELLIRLRSLSWFPKTYLKAFKRVEGQCGTVLDHTLQLLSQQRHGDKIFNCSNFSSWQAFKCERMNTNTLKYTSAGPGSSCRGRGRRGGPAGLTFHPQVGCSNTRQYKETSQTTWIEPPKIQSFLHPGMFLIFRLWTGFMKYFSAPATATVATPWIGNNKFTV